MLLEFDAGQSGLSNQVVVTSTQRQHHRRRRSKWEQHDSAVFVIFLKAFYRNSPDNTTIVEMGLYQGIVDVMQYFWRNKRFNSLYGTNAGDNFFE